MEKKRSVKTVLAAFAGILVLALAMSGCHPTYLKEKFTQAITDICKKEYKLDVKVKTVGKTVAVYLPLENLIDFTFSITKSAGEKINNVILTVSRVALSTDAKYDFYVVIAHDIRVPEIQIVIIKTVDDVKHFLLNDISRDEYAKRMIIDIRFSPQAQKEKAVKDVFEKIAVDKKAQEEVMSDFFRTDPTGLGDIGYWDGKFYIKDINLPEFMAEQMATRVKMAFHEDKALQDGFLLKAIKCSYQAKDGNVFRMDISAEKRLAPGSGKEPDDTHLLKAALDAISKVAYYYKFKDFAGADISYVKEKEYFRASKEELEGFRKKKLKLEYFTGRK